MSINKYGEKLDNLQKLFNIGQWCQNLETGERLWSDEIYHLYGLPIGTTPLDTLGLGKYYAHADLERMSQMVQECLKGNKVTGNIFYANLDNGQMACHFSSCESIKDNDGKPIAIHGLMLDITKFKEIWAGFNYDSIAPFSTLVENLDEVIFHADNTGHLIFLNTAWENIAGYKVDDSLGGKLCNFIIPEDAVAFIEQISGLKQNAYGYFNIECRLKRKDSTLVWVNMYVSAIKNRDNAIVGLTGRIMDASKLRHYIDEIGGQRNFYESIINNGSFDVAVFNEKGQYIYLNKKAIADDKLRQWIIGKDDFDYYELKGKAADRAIERHKYFEQALEKRQPVFFEEKSIKDDKDEYVLRTYTPLYNGNGSLKFVIGYGIDITKRIEWQLHNHKLNEAIQKATDGIAMSAAGRGFYYINAAFAKCFSYDSPDELAGKQWNDLFDLSMFEQLRDKVVTTLKSTGNWSGSIETETRKGNKIAVEITISTLANNEHLYICRDVSEKNRQQQELEKLAAVASKTNSLVIISDKKGQVEWVNEGFMRVFKYTLDELKGKLFLSVVSGAGTNPQTVKLLREAVMAGGALRGEILIYAKDGTPVWMFFDVAPVKDEQGNIISFIGVHSDITAMKQAEQAIKDTLEEEKKLSDLKSRFINLASHEFRTPLATIQSSADIINALAHKKDITMLSNISGHTKKIGEQVDKISEVMDNVFMMGRMEAGRIHFKPEPDILSTFIDRLVKKDLSKENKLYKNIPMQVQGQIVSSFFDPLLMEHVIKNLLSNALKYSAGKPSPEITITYTQAEVIIEVKDYGIGIPAHEHESVFQSFFRASNVDYIQGTGLGLVLVKQFVYLHKGVIYFESELNQGTSFFVHLPIKTNA